MSKLLCVVNIHLLWNSNTIVKVDFTNVLWVASTHEDTKSAKKKILMTWLSIFGFGIYECKSFSKNIGKIGRSLLWSTRD